MSELLCLLNTNFTGVVLCSSFLEKKKHEREKKIRPIVEFFLLYMKNKDFFDLCETDDELESGRVISVLECERELDHHFY